MNVVRGRNSEDRLEPFAESGRILAIDYGHRRIGLALSDELGLTAQPLAVILRKNRLVDMRRLREICLEHAICRIIVGCPIHMTGEQSDMAAEATRFAARLRKILHVETEMVDERLTSWEARQIASQKKGGPISKRAAVDDLAAAVLLRDYLERQRETPTPAPETERA